MSKGLVLISGVNGYIAAVTAKHFLDHGYSVRGTVRKQGSAEDMIKGPLKDYADSGAFEVVEVRDITVDGAFDEAVNGVTNIAHLASPVSLDFKDPAPIIHTAVTGTQTILNSALAHAGPQLKSVVLMSSIVSALNSHPAPYTVTEADWNDYAEAMCEEKGTDTPGPVIYMASKTAGEKAFWAWRDEKNPTFSMSAINPSLVYGPPLLPPATPSAVGGTLSSIYAIFSGASNVPAQPAPFNASVDVRDVAELFRYAVSHPDETNGERYIANGFASHPKLIAEALRKDAESKGDGKALQRIKVWKGDGEEEVVQGVEIDARKGRGVLERGEWRALGESVVDTVGMFGGLI